MQVTAKVRGSRETSAALRALAKQVAVPLNATSRYALQPTLAAARRNVRAQQFEESTGALAASLTIKRLPKSSKVNPRHRVGPAADFQRGDRKPVRYAHLVEFGTVAKTRAGGIEWPGSAPHPFLTPAYYATRDEVVKRFGARIGPEMEKRAAKLNKKVPR
jgi:hypothetical protein